MSHKPKPKRNIQRLLAEASIILIMVLVIGLAALQPPITQAEDGWLYFAGDASLPGTKYYYDLESIRYYSRDRVRAWIKIKGSLKEHTMEAEINCSGRLFRLVQTPPKDMWDKLLCTRPSQTQYIVAGWQEIPPGSEMHVLRKLLCNDPLKDS